MSKQVLVGEGSDEVGHYIDLVHGALDSNDKALGDKRLRNHLAKGFDVVIVSPFIASEAGYYLAEKTNADLVLFWTVQSSISVIDWAMGQPNNPAYMPFVFLDYYHPMTFIQRVINTAGAYVFHLIR